jgi:aryl-alcohol dehydrogenase-like predicted oxidoreductase
MKYALLGTSDLRVSELSFGCMSLGSDHANNAELLLHAFEQGITLFDTADLYQQGQNEITVGNALKGVRHKVLIATKVGNQWREDGSGWDWNPRKDYILQAVDESLKRLQTDYIDLYQLHGGTIDDPIDETIEAFELLKQTGKIRHYGISSIRPNVIREYLQHSNIVSVMMQYSLLDRRPEESCLELLQQHTVGVLARGPLAKGLLVDKPASSYLNYNQEEVGLAANAIRSISGDRRSAAQTALRFVLHHPALTTAVVGIRTMQQLEDCLGGIEAPPLTGEDIQTLKEVLPANTYEKHR